MDDSSYNELEDEEFVLQRPMHSYVSAVSNIDVPSLDLDSDFEGEEDEQPLVYHPFLDPNQEKESEIFDKEVQVAQKVKNVADKIVETVPQKIYFEDEHRNGITTMEDEGPLTMLSKANLAEMELDNAILTLSPSHSLDVVPGQHAAGILSDSNSSSSSVLGKLTETMDELKREHEMDVGELDNKLTDLQTKSKGIQMVHREPRTKMLDLRNQKVTSNETLELEAEKLGQEEVTVNRCVLQRYGSCAQTSDDEDIENEDFRRRLKRESEMIARNKGKLKDHSSAIKDGEDSGVNLSTPLLGMKSEMSGSSSLDLSARSSSNRTINKDSVDSMLANVNRIMSRGNENNKVESVTDVYMKPLKEEALKQQNSNDVSTEEEYVKSYVVFDQKTGEESSISPDPSTHDGIDSIAKEDNPEIKLTDTNEKYIEMKELPKKSSSVDLELNAQVVDWSDVFWTECKEISGSDSHDTKEDIKAEVSDNLFSNSIFSKYKTNTSSATETKTNTKPKKNILSNGKTKNILGLKKSVTIAENVDAIVSKVDSKKMCSVMNRQMAKTDTIKKKTSIDKADLIKCSNCEGDVVKCNGCLKEGIVASVETIVKDAKKNFENGHLDQKKMTEMKHSSEKINRQLKYSNNEAKTETNFRKMGELNHDEKSPDKCLACHVNNPGSETPIKHNESVCVNNNNNVVLDNNTEPKVEQKIKKTTQSRGTSTNILNLLDANTEKENSNTVVAVNGIDSKNHVEEITSSLNKDNKENSIDATTANNNNDITETNSATVTTKNSKNRKKKKSKNKAAAAAAAAISGDNNKPTEVVEKPVKPINNVKRKGLEQLDSFLKEISQDGKEKVLFDEVVSFEQNNVSFPVTDKQLLLLKVPLESPGVCKTKVNDSIHTFADQNNSDNYIGLVTLFVYLLHGTRRELSMINLDIPFDVVSLQQAHLDGELLLIVGISENKNACQQKTKRTKLGTSFFHAVSQFLNTNFLDKILCKIWEHTEADVSRIQNSLSFNHIWRQVELKTAERCTIPGSGKLSSFINISPDTNAMQRIFNLYPSLLVHVENKTGSSIPTEYNWFNPASVHQDYTCITVENATSISPKHLSELLKRLRKESVEICGLRIGYSVKDHSLFMPTLSICINEFKAATADEGKLLLSDCEELKELAISFNNTQDNISVIMNGSPLLKYTINPQRSHRQVVQWFGPNYKDVTDLKNTLTELKSNNKVSKNKNDKQKWALGSCNCQLSLLNSYMSSAVLFISALVPSAFISFVISIALKKGLQLKMVYKTCCSVSQLGFPEDKGDFFFYTDNDKRKGLVANRCMVSCILLLFNGKSAALRLLGLICKLTEILNNPLTGETLAPWMVDKMIKFPPSHNTNDNSAKLNSVPKEYFGVLQFNDHIKELLSTSFKPPKPHIVEDLYPILSKVRINQSRPEINVMALLLYGEEILQDVPTILRTIFSDTAYSCLNSWRQSVRCRPFAIKYQPAIEFLGTKYINSITKLQACNLINQDYNEKEIYKLVGKKAVLVMLKAIDKRTFTHINESISKYTLSSKLELSKSNYITHTDTEYVFRLMFHFFEPIELHGDQLKDESQIPSFCLPDHHILFTVLDNVLDTRIHNQVIVKKKLPDKDWKNILPHKEIPTTSLVYQFSPSSLSFPLQMLLRSEKSYAGVSFEYMPHNMQTIAKALARLCRMGFQLSSLKFPSYDTNNGTCHLRAVFLREDAVFVLNKMVSELEMNYPKLRFTFTDMVHGVNNFIQNEIKGSSESGGIFHCNYYALVNGLNFEKEECFEKRKQQEVEWNPENCNFDNGMWYVKKENTPLSITGSLVASTDEVSVILITEPLLSGRYMGKRLPENCVFPEILNFLETATTYRMIAGKTTMLTKEAADEIVDVYNVDEKKKIRMVKQLSHEGGPFVAITLVGSCILTNFWLTMERKLANEDAVNVLRHHTLVPSTKKQVETLLVSLFDQVVLNTKVEIKTKLS